MGNSQIRFRAWQKYHKKMVEVTSISFDDNGEINGVATFVENQAPQRISYRDDLLGRFFLKDESGMVLELMQYTGLKDKNGVEIYEGDILFHPLQGRRKVFYPYSETVASYGLRDIDNGFGSTLQDSHAIWEVIGNIYENKELLEREAE